MNLQIMYRTGRDTAAPRRIGADSMEQEIVCNEFSVRAAGAADSRLHGNRSSRLNLESVIFISRRSDGK